MAHYLLHDLPGASFPAAAPQSPIVLHLDDQGTAMEKFTQDELDHLFAALLLHTKTTREEQAAWVTERSEIWRKIVAASDAQGTEQTVYRTNLFNSPEHLRRFWKSPDEMEKALTLPAASPSVTAKTKRAAR